MWKREQHSQTQTVSDKMTADFGIILESGSKWLVIQQMNLWTSRGNPPKKQINDCWIRYRCRTSIRFLCTRVMEQSCVRIKHKFLFHRIFLRCCWSLKALWKLSRSPTTIHQKMKNEAAKPENICFVSQKLSSVLLRHHAPHEPSLQRIVMYFKTLCSGLKCWPTS